MGKNPAVLFYTSDFLSGTILMNYEDKGRYISLLCLQHQIYPERIPENHMISVCLSLDNQAAKKFIKDEKGFYYNERMEQEIKKRVSFCESRSNNKSGRPEKKSYDSTYDKSHDNHMSLHMENENDNENKEEKEIRKIVPPKIEWVTEYCNERKNNVIPQKWYDFYQSKNWMIGKNKMKDWQAAIRTWENNPSQRGYEPKNTDKPKTSSNWSY